MKCTKCGLEKSAYDFYSQRGTRTNATRFFFVNPEWSATQCWSCNGDYRCLGCGVEKAAGEFRVGGRFCDDCEVNGNRFKTAAIYNAAM